MHDLKYAFRALVRQPVFSVVALLTLALGIGANSAIFSLVKGVLLDGLPYEDSEAIVVAWERKPEGGTEFVSPPTFLDWKDRASTMSALAAFRHVRHAFSGSPRSSRATFQPGVQPASIPSRRCAWSERH